jgi:hypothetical protein
MSHRKSDLGIPYPRKSAKVVLVHESRVTKKSNILSDRIGYLPERLAKSRKNPLQEPVRELHIIIDTGNAAHRHE